MPATKTPKVKVPNDKQRELLSTLNRGRKALVEETNGKKTAKIVTQAGAAVAGAKTTAAVIEKCTANGWLDAGGGRTELGDKARKLKA